MASRGTKRFENIKLLFIFVVLIGFVMLSTENTYAPGADAIPSIHGRTDKPSAEVASIFTKMSTKYKTYPGQRFTRLTVIRNFIRIDKRGYKWHFAELRCDCGNIVEASVYDLFKKKSTTKSCGCYTKDRVTKHGMFGTRLYGIWSDMKVRTTRPDNHDYKNYGARGIKVCREWNKFIPFMEWALSHGYQDNLTIDRIDNDGDYCPENCRFLTLMENIWNKRRTERYCIHEYKGKKHSLFRVKVMRDGLTYVLPSVKTFSEAVKIRNEFLEKHEKRNQNEDFSRSYVGRRYGRRNRRESV